MLKSKVKLFFNEIGKNKKLQTEVENIIGGNYNSEEKKLLNDSENNFNFTNEEILSQNIEIKNTLGNKYIKNVIDKALKRVAVVALIILSSLSFIGAESSLMVSASTNNSQFSMKTNQVPLCEAGNKEHNCNTNDNESSDDIDFSKKPKISRETCMGELENGINYTFDEGNGILFINSNSEENKEITQVDMRYIQKSIGYRSIKNLYIGKNITSIGENAFIFQASLIEINIPANVISIGNNTFFSYCNLKKIIWNGSTYNSVNEFLNAFNRK